MYTPFKAAVFAISAFVLVFIGSLAAGNTANAQEAPVEGPKIHFEPKCTNVEKTMMYWQVTNDGSTGAIRWQNRDNGTEGSLVLEPGITLMPIVVKPGVNNTTDFMWTYGTSTSNSLSDAICEDTTPVNCIDASNAANLTYTWDLTSVAGYASITVQTKDGTPVCDDTQLFFTSYSLPPFYNGMPLDYNNGMFGNPTAYPQLRVNTDTIVLKKGEDTSATLTVMLPNPCIATQLDLYYGPEITEVGVNGHGTQNIASTFITSVGSCDGGNGGTTPTEPEIPVTPVTPTTPPVVIPEGGNGGAGDTTPVVPQIPAELPETGAQTQGSATALLALLAGLVTYGLLYQLLPQKKN